MPRTYKKYAKTYIVKIEYIAPPSNKDGSLQDLDTIIHGILSNGIPYSEVNNLYKKYTGKKFGVIMGMQHDYTEVKPIFEY